MTINAFCLKNYQFLGFVVGSLSKMKIIPDSLENTFIQLAIPSLGKKFWNSDPILNEPKEINEKTQRATASASLTLQCNRHLLLQRDYKWIGVTINLKNWLVKNQLFRGFMLNPKCNTRRQEGFMMERPERNFNLKIDPTQSWLRRLRCAWSQIDPSIYSQAQKPFSC